MRTQTKPAYRVVEYKNGYPQSKIEFEYSDDAEAYRDKMVAERAAQRAKGYWVGTSFHYIAEHNY